MSVPFVPRAGAWRALLRLTVGLGVPLFTLLGVRWLLHGGGSLCPVYELSGLFCPGCGAGRAARALLQGRFLDALGHNALFCLLGLPCATLLAREYLRFVFPRLGLRRLRLSVRVGRIALALLLAFCILRNLPAFSFLAP